MSSVSELFIIGACVRTVSDGSLDYNCVSLEPWSEMRLIRTSVRTVSDEALIRILSDWSLGQNYV